MLRLCDWYIYQRSEESECLVDHEDATVFSNFGNHLPVDTALNPRIFESAVPFISFFYIFFDLIAGTSLYALSHLKGHFVVPTT
jgi:hypothetical protein